MAQHHPVAAIRTPRPRLVTVGMPGSGDFFPMRQSWLAVVRVEGHYPAIAARLLESLPRECAPRTGIGQTPVRVSDPVDLPGCLCQRAEAGFALCERISI